MMSPVLFGPPDDALSSTLPDDDVASLVGGTDCVDDENAPDAELVLGDGDNEDVETTDTVVGCDVDAFEDVEDSGVTVTLGTAAIVGSFNRVSVT